MPRTNHSRKQQILDRTMEIILSEGIGNLTIRKVADAAQVSTGLVLHHFASKEGLIADAWQQTLTRLNERLGVSGEAEGIEWFEAVYRGRFEGEAATVPLIFWLEYWLYAARTPSLRQHHSESYIQWRELEVERVAAGVNAGEIRGDLDARLIADMFHVVFCGLAVKAVLDHETITRERALDLSRFFLSLIAPPKFADGSGTRAEIARTARTQT